MKSHLRYATQEDMDLLFEWANEDEVRRNSFSTEKISYDEHKEWYKQLLTRADRKQYIYEYDNEAIGQARISIEGEIAEIGYSICASKRGMGHGKNLLQLLYNQVRIDFPNVKKLVGKVKVDNIASQRTFLEVGYTESYKAYEMDISGSQEYISYVKSGGGTLFNK